jgi:hypothetical protein
MQTDLRTLANSYSASIDEFSLWQGWADDDAGARSAYRPIIYRLEKGDCDNRRKIFEEFSAIIELQFQEAQERTAALEAKVAGLLEAQERSAATVAALEAKVAGLLEAQERSAAANEENNPSSCNIM